MLYEINKFFIPFILGASFGFVVQRGFFCLNSGSTDFLTRKDSSKMSAFLLAIGIQVIAFSILFRMAPGWIPHSRFQPVPAILGGLVFGFSMFYAGGCASGVWFKVGEGKVGAILAIVGLIAGLLLTPHFLMPLLSSFIDAGAMTNGNMHMITPLASIFAIAIGVILLGYLVRKPNSCPKTSTVGWKTTGSMLAVIGILSWISSHYAGRPYGMGIIGGSADIYFSIRRLSIPAIPWEMLFVLGIPVGSFISAKRDNKFKLQAPTLMKIHRPLLGGLGMGVGSSLAAGCTVGQGLVGIPILSLTGMATFAAILFGVWIRIGFQKMLPVKS